MDILKNEAALLIIDMQYGGGALDGSLVQQRMCVLETCSNAFSLNYNCIVPEETTASFTLERKQMGLEMLRFGRSQVVKVAQVYEMLGGDIE